MKHLHWADASRVLDAVYELASVQRLDELPLTATKLAYGLIPSVWCGWMIINLANGTIEGVQWPEDFGQLLGQMADDLLEVPLAAELFRNRSPQILTISDVWSQQEWHNKRFYSEIYRPEGMEVQIVAPVSFTDPLPHSLGPRIEGLVLVRSLPDFSNRDRAVLAEFVRHVRAVARRLRAQSWNIGPDAAAQLGLTARQSQALQSIADGSTMYAAAERIGVSPKTLENHLQAAYARLKVNNRTAALARLRSASAGEFAMGEIPH